MADLVGEGPSERSRGIGSKVALGDAQVNAVDRGVGSGREGAANFTGEVADQQIAVAQTRQIGAAKVQFVDLNGVRHVGEALLARGR